MPLDLNLTSTICQHGGGKTAMWLLGAALGALVTKCHPKQHKENVKIPFFKTKHNWSALAHCFREHSHPQKIAIFLS